MLDDDRCYAAASSRDRRFDGQFIVAVRTTGIYCRPSCPAITPKRSNVEFHRTAAAAQQRGFRACKRCRPDSTPGASDWNVRHDVVARAMRLIGDGIVERDGVGGLARRLGYSVRHLNRLVSDELGAGPLAIARAQRAQTSRQLIETTDLPLTDVAFAAGFGSVRQFNDTIRAVFDSTPSDLRVGARRHRTGPATPTGAGADAMRDDRASISMTSTTLRLPTRTPFAGREVLDFIGRRAIPGIEVYTPGVDGGSPVYVRGARLPGGPAEIEIGLPDDPRPDHVSATVRLTDWSDLATCVQRIRRMLDLDADPCAVDEHFASDPILGPLVSAVPGRRSAVGLDPFETLVRAIVGQQISVAGARTVTAHLVDSCHRSTGDESDLARATTLHPFPTPESVADAPDAAFSMPTSRRDTIRRAAEAVACDEIVLDVGADPDETRRRLLALRGIGPWTADYVLMRALGHPDVLLATDLGVRHALSGLDVTPTELARSAPSWSPWGSYATHHLWATLDASESMPRTTPEGAHR